MAKNVGCQFGSDSCSFERLCESNPSLPPTVCHDALFLQTDAPSEQLIRKAHVADMAGLVVVHLRK